MSERSWTVRGGEDVGRAVAEIRRARHLTQTELAELAALDRTYVSKIETGRSASVFEHALRLLHRLGATVTITFESHDAEA